MSKHRKSNASKAIKNPIKQYLIANCRAHKKHVFEGGYTCLEEFVLKNGRSFESVISLPSDIVKGPAGNCFDNAFWIALRNKNKYYYCEGYAVSDKRMMPILHAWLVNKKHEVIDPTYSSGKYYYGFAFKLPYVCHWIPLNKGHKSVLDNWMQGWPLLKESPKELKRHLQFS